MANYRRQHDEDTRRHEREVSDRGGDDARSWFSEDEARRRHGNDERDQRYPYGGERGSRYEPSREGFDRGSRWEGAPDDRSYGMYRSDDRAYHDRFRREHPVDHSHGRDRSTNDRNDAAQEYYRAARDQRDDFLRWSAQNVGTWGDQGHVQERDGGGYGRADGNRQHFGGRGPKGYQRSDDRVREEICDCMTDDPMLDASEITVDVKQGEVFLSGTVTSRSQKRRAEDVVERISGVRDVTNQLRIMRDSNGHSWDADSSRASASGNNAASQPATPASGKGTPSTTTSSTTA
jgi:osmotically-inducible protein OsmY